MLLLLLFLLQVLLPLSLCVGVATAVATIAAVVYDAVAASSGNALIMVVVVGANVDNVVFATAVAATVAFVNDFVVAATVAFVNYFVTTTTALAAIIDNAIFCAFVFFIS